MHSRTDCGYLEAANALFTLRGSDNPTPNIYWCISLLEYERIKNHSKPHRPLINEIFVDLWQFALKPQPHLEEFVVFNEAAFECINGTRAGEYAKKTQANITVYEYTRHKKITKAFLPDYSDSVMHSK